VKHLKRHLSPATVLSSIALFAALAGGAYAATAMLPNKSVKTRHLAKGVITTQKLRNGAVTAAKIRNGNVIAGKIAPGAVGPLQLLDGGVRSRDLGGGVVTAGKIKNGSVTTEKLAADAVTTGKLSDGAVTAAKLAPSFGAQLVKNVSYVTKASGIIPIDEETLTAECPAGKQVLGGGGRILGGTKKVALIESAPAINATGSRVGWTASAREYEVEAADWTLEVYAICAEL
jgi:hypothetical protein